MNRKNLFFAFGWLVLGSVVLSGYKYTHQSTNASNAYFGSVAVENNQTVGGTLGVTGATTLANVTVTGTTTNSGTNASGIGTDEVTSATHIAYSDLGNVVVHKTILTLTMLNVPIVDATTNGIHGSKKLYTFPEGHVTALSVHSVYSAITAGNGNIRDTGILDVGLGSVPAATDGELTSTEANLGILDGLQLAAGAGTGDATVTTDVTLDGSSTAEDVWLNIVGLDAAATSNGNQYDNVAVSAVITIIWTLDGDD
jgi:hypothetical protein